MGKEYIMQNNGIPVQSTHMGFLCRFIILKFGQKKHNQQGFPWGVSYYLLP